MADESRSLDVYRGNSLVRVNTVYDSLPEDLYIQLRSGYLTVKASVQLERLMQRHGLSAAQPEHMEGLIDLVKIQSRVKIVGGIEMPDSLGDLEQLVKPIEDSAREAYVLLLPLVKGEDYFQYSDPEGYFSELSEGGLGVYLSENEGLTWGTLRRKNKWSKNGNVECGVVLKGENPLWKMRMLRIKLRACFPKDNLSIRKFIKLLKVDFENTTEKGNQRITYLKHLLLFPKLIPAFAEEIKVEKLRKKAEEKQRIERDIIRPVRRGGRKPW